MNTKLRTILIVLLSAVLIYSVTRIVMIQIEYQKADDIYEESRTEHFHVSQDEAIPQPVESGETPEESKEYFPEAYADIEDLLSVNPDIVGWIWIPNTNINFPLLRAADNLKYLSRSYNLQWTNSGSIFMDYRNSPDLTSDNTVIYGHNIKNGSMFGSLKEYSDADYLEKHPNIYIFTQNQIFKYKIFAAYKTESTSESYTLDFSDSIGYDDYINYVTTSAGDSMLSAPTDETPLLMLSTCTSVRRTERFVVNASLVAVKSID